MVDVEEGDSYWCEEVKSSRWLFLGIVFNLG